MLTSMNMSITVHTGAELKRHLWSNLALEGIPVREGGPAGETIS